VNNTHAPIVKKSVWDKVQQINGAAREKMLDIKEPQQSLFSGLVVCSDCGAKMGYVASTTKLAGGSIGRYGGYNCRTYNRSGQAVCSSHRISERFLNGLVLESIREKASGLMDENGMFEIIKGELVKGYRANKIDAMKTRQELEQQLYSLESQIDQLYENKVEGTISADTFAALAGKIEIRRLEIESELESLNQASEGTALKVFDIDRWASLIKEKSTSLEVDRELLESLIEKIEIGQRQITDCETVQDVRIFYKYVGLC
jgi:hypothetical protein